jgi:sulfane dehydrogenase subunit SoxC
MRAKPARLDLLTGAVGVVGAAADLQDPVLPIAHTRFRYMWNLDGKPAEIMSRATDETGYVQPAFEQLKEAREGVGYHMNPVTSWTVDTEGRVLFGIDRVSS